MEKLNKDYENKGFKKPSSVVSSSICTKCGKRAIEGVCNIAVGGPCNKNEFFDKDSLPTETCDCHVKCIICKSSSQLAGDNCPSSSTYTTVYLQKKEQNDKTDDAPLIIPSYLQGSLCQVHN